MEPLDNRYIKYRLFNPEIAPESQAPYEFRCQQSTSQFRPKKIKIEFKKKPALLIGIRSNRIFLSRFFFGYFLSSSSGVALFAERFPVPSLPPPPFCPRRKANTPVIRYANAELMKKGVEVGGWVGGGERVGVGGGWG